MTQVEKIIRKHYNPHFKNLNWETCGQAIEKLIRQKTDKIRTKNLAYLEECQKIDSCRRKIENEYESYFSYKDYFRNTAGYDWINGNEKLTQLLNQ